MATMTDATTESNESRDYQVLVALVFGAVLTLVGVLGPVLGGAESDLLGLFGRNYLHDAVHVLSGAFGLVAGFAAGGAMSHRYNRYLGLVYLLVFVLGAAALFAGFTELTGLINLNWADNVLHLLLGVVLLGVGYGLGSR